MASEAITINPARNHDILDRGRDGGVAALDATFRVNGDVSLSSDLDHGSLS